MSPIPKNLSLIRVHSYILVVLSLIWSANAQNRFVVPWSPEKYGPDGPWQAVKITAGGNDSSLFIEAQNHTELDVYPGGVYETLTVSPKACAPYPKSLCGAGGTWEPDASDVAYQRVISQSVAYPYNTEDDSYGMLVRKGVNVHLGLTINEKTVWNASVVSVDYGNITYPNGVVGGIPLGHLSLGAPNTAQYFMLSDSQVADGNITAWIFPGKLYQDKLIQSYSYGLHIGSAAFDYAGSLVFGGYNKGRVIGPVTSFTDYNSVDLLDIGIGVEFGESPFSFAGKQNLLSTGKAKVRPDPLAPYLSLPAKTCESLAELLPVTFDKTLKYYTWDTGDPQFAKIVSSPAYISFTFAPAPGTADNVVIKVPFALLNLTLDTPITERPTQYFPCVPYDTADEPPVLGRAFLQAAFIGRNWKTETSWLAQAPGPGALGLGLGDQYVDIADTATTIDGFAGGNLFNQTWEGHWSVIASQKPKSNDSKTEEPVTETAKGLSTGAKAGIGVGAAVGGLLLIAGLVVLWLWRKRSARPSEVNGTHQSPAEMSETTAAATGPEGQHFDGWAVKKPITEELYGDYEHVPVEVPDRNNPAHR